MERPLTGPGGQQEPLRSSTWVAEAPTQLLLVENLNKAAQEGEVDL